MIEGRQYPMASYFRTRMVKVAMLLTSYRRTEAERRSTPDTMENPLSDRLHSRLSFRQELTSALQLPPEPRVIREWTKDSKRLCVVLRDDGDVQVEFHIEGQRGSPLSSSMLPRTNPRRRQRRKIETFVQDLVEKRLVLALDNRPIRGWTNVRRSG